LGTIGVGAITASLVPLSGGTGSGYRLIATLGDLGTAHARTGFMEHAVEGQRHLFLLIWSGGQEAGQIQKVEEKSVDLQLQFWADLAFEIAEARFRGNLLFEAQPATQLLAVLTLQDA
jgi:hypothetical protein